MKKDKKFPEKAKCKECGHRHNPGNPWCQAGCGCSHEYKKSRPHKEKKK